MINGLEIQCNRSAWGGAIFNLKYKDWIVKDFLSEADAKTFLVRLLFALSTRPLRSNELTYWEVCQAIQDLKWNIGECEYEE